MRYFFMTVSIKIKVNRKVRLIYLFHIDVYLKLYIMWVGERSNSRFLQICILDDSVFVSFNVFKVSQQ